MANAIARPVNLKQNIPAYLPLADAAKKFGMSRKVLTQMIRAGKIKVVQLPSGELLVAAENNGKQSKTKEEIIAREFTHLRKRPITVSQAEDYDLPRRKPHYFYLLHSSTAKIASFFIE